MAICKNCNESVISSDICGGFCVHCYGTDMENKSQSVEGGYVCGTCGEYTKTLCNDMCNGCYEVSIEDRNKGSKCDFCGERSWAGKQLIYADTGYEDVEYALCSKCINAYNEGRIVLK